MKIVQVYDNGNIVPQEVYNIDPASLLASFQSGIKNLVGLSLEAGYPIEATVPLIIGNAFKNIAALSLESGFKIPELSLITSSQPAQSVPEVKATTTKAPVKEEKKPVKEEPKEEEEEGGMGGLFDWLWENIWFDIFKILKNPFRTLWLIDYQI